MNDPKSYRVGVKTPGDDDFHFNGCRFATEAEAKAYGEDLQWRWTAVTEWQVFLCPMEPTYRRAHYNKQIAAGAMRESEAAMGMVAAKADAERLWRKDRQIISTMAPSDFSEPGKEQAQ